VYGIEAMPSTFEKLNSTVHKLGWQESLRIHHAAMSETDGFTLFPNADVGVEDLGIDECSKPQYRESCQNVTQYKLDTFLDHHVMSNIPNQTIDFLSIDVEGYDWPVLLGSTSALQQTKYLEFEYHYVGAWKKFALLTAIDTLQDQGFCCYWAGRAGKLWRITGCWLEHSHSKQWSNVACVNRGKAPTLSSCMEEQFFETLGNHEKLKEAAANRTSLKQSFFYFYLFNLCTFHSRLFFFFYQVEMEVGIDLAPY
jgi:FkbM family methyltransferase